MKRVLVSLIFALALVVTAVASVDNLRFPISFDVAKERDSPRDRIGEQDIHVYKSRVVLDVPNVKWATFTDTNSMDPLFDEGSNTLEIQPESPLDIEVGDIISYHYDDRIIVHRVTEIGLDSEGIYYIVQGDNNKTQDPTKVRFDQINGVVIGILY